VQVRRHSPARRAKGRGPYRTGPLLQTSGNPPPCLTAVLETPMQPIRKILALGALGFALAGIAAQPLTAQ